MKSGRLNQRVLFQRRVTVQNDAGEGIITYVDAFYAMAAVEPLTGRELFNAQQTQAEIDSRIRIRWRRDVEADMRVVHTSSYASPQLFSTYDIRAVLDLRAQHDEVHLLCLRRATDQNLGSRPAITADMDNITADNG